MTKEGSTKIVISWPSGAGVLMLGRGHISHCNEYVVSSTLSIYSPLIAITRAKGLWCCFPIPSLIFVYSLMGLLIYKYEPLWQEVSVNSLILRWPLRPVGLLLTSDSYLHLVHGRNKKIQKSALFHTSEIKGYRPTAAFITSTFIKSWDGGLVPIGELAVSLLFHLEREVVLGLV